MAPRSLLVLFSIAFGVAVIFAVITTIKYVPPTSHSHASLTELGGLEKSAIVKNNPPPQALRQIARKW